MLEVGMAERHRSTLPHADEGWIAAKRADLADCDDHAGSTGGRT